MTLLLAMARTKPPVDPSTSETLPTETTAAVTGDTAEPCSPGEMVGIINLYYSELSGGIEWNEQRRRHGIAPEGVVDMRARSGLAVKHGVTVLNAPGTVDADYRGELRIALINHGREPVEIKRGECWLRDDGGFTLPEELILAEAAAPREVIATLSRVATRLHEVAPDQFIQVIAVVHTSYEIELAL